MTDDVSNSKFSKLNSTQQNMFMASNILSRMVSSSFGPYGLNKLTLNYQRLQYLVFLCLI